MVLQGLMEHEIGALAEEIRLMTYRVARRLRQEAGAPEDWTQAQDAVVFQLDRAGELTGAELARLEGVRAQSMSLTVKKLEELQIVEGRLDPKDGRRLLLRLTEAGKHALSTARRRKHKWLATYVESLTPDEREELKRVLISLETASQ